MIREHFPEYVGAICLCGFEIDNAGEWANHLAEQLPACLATRDRAPNDPGPIATKHTMQETAPVDAITKAMEKASAMTDATRARIRAAMTMLSADAMTYLAKVRRALDRHPDFLPSALAIPATQAVVDEIRAADPAEIAKIFGVDHWAAHSFINLIGKCTLGVPDPERTHEALSPDTMNYLAEVRKKPPRAARQVAHSQPRHSRRGGCVGGSSSAYGDELPEVRVRSTLAPGKS